MEILIIGLIAIALVAVAVACYAERFKLKPIDAVYRAMDFKEKSATPRFRFYKKFWGVLFWAVICCCMFACSSQVETSTFVESQEVTEWNADNIPIPYLTDRTQYVSNPDTVLRQNTVDSLNAVLGRLETECQVQSVVVVVKRVENGDAFRVAQDLGNKYGVGDKETNRGLVIVVAYDDHKYFIAPGTGLEADLTDAECGQLARTYLTPYLKVNNPDSGMYQLVESTYNLLKGKELPAEPDEQRLRMQSPQDDGVSDFGSGIFLLLFFWIMFYARLNETYRWLLLTSSGGTGFTGFGRDRAGSGGRWGSGWSGGGFGGGFSGGHFGGGHFGGGGAGGSW